MQIKHDVKGQLAKLLATEDLIVEHRSVETASFNVASRVLTLPTWDKAGEEVYDLLVCHEVGHAYTHLMRSGGLIMRYHIQLLIL